MPDPIRLYTTSPLCGQRPCPLASRYRYKTIVVFLWFLIKKRYGKKRAATLGVDVMEGGIICPNKNNRAKLINNEADLENSSPGSFGPLLLDRASICRLHAPSQKRSAHHSRELPRGRRDNQGLSPWRGNGLLQGSDRVHYPGREG